MPFPLKRFFGAFFRLNTTYPTDLSHPFSQDKKNKFSRKRLNEDEGDITYINERNRVFNKKVSPFIFILYLHPPLTLTFYNRLRATTTNTPRRSGPASSAALPCEEDPRCVAFNVLYCPLCALPVVGSCVHLCYFYICKQPSYRSQRRLGTT